MLKDRRSCFDKQGASFDIVPCSQDMIHPVLAMYNQFSPRPASQGLPPANDELMNKWLRGLVDGGRNVVAVRGDAVIGHATITPDFARSDCEFVIFVHQDHRSLGIGSMLTETMIEEARMLKMACVWLTVDTRNVRAIRLYRKFKFEYCDSDPCERFMMLKF